MTGRRVLAAIAALLMLTAVLPPAVAWSVNHRRVTRAAADLASIAAALAAWPTADGEPQQRIDVLYGAGGMPPVGSAEAAGWSRAPRAGLSAIRGAPAIGPDPWGNCYLVDVGALVRTGRGLALSAGPDSLIDTPYGALDTGGDDIGMVLTRGAQ
jgi:hypothetical protein